MSWTLFIQIAGLIIITGIMGVALIQERNKR